MDKKIEVLTLFTVLLLGLIAGCSGCRSEKSDAKNFSSKPAHPKPVNIIVIIDTSDRISKEKQPGQAEKDIEITKEIVKIFEEKFVRPNFYISKDTLAFVVPDQPGAPPIPQSTVNDLKIWLSPTDQARLGGAPKVQEMKRALLRAQKMKRTLLQAIDQLYEFINKQNQFPGSDIWSWFKHSAEVYLKRDTLNYIICLSDGYLDFNNDIQMNRPKRTYMSDQQLKKFRETENWKQEFHTGGHGLLEIGKDFSKYNVKFLMVEMKKREMLELEIIEEYWRVWLESMGIVETEFLSSQGAAKTVINHIKAFMSP